MRFEMEAGHQLMECAGRAKRRRRFSRAWKVSHGHAAGASESGVAAALCHRSPKWAGECPQQWPEETAFATQLNKIYAASQQ